MHHLHRKTYILPCELRKCRHFLISRSDIQCFSHEDGCSAADNEPQIMPAGQRSASHACRQRSASHACRAANHKPRLPAANYKPCLPGSNLQAMPAGQQSTCPALRSQTASHACRYQAVKHTCWHSSLSHKNGTPCAIRCAISRFILWVRCAPVQRPSSQPG